MERPIDRIRRELDLYQGVAKSLEELKETISQGKGCEEQTRILSGIGKAHIAAHQLMSSLHASRISLQRQCLHKKRVTSDDSEYCKECGKTLKIFKH